MAFNQIIYFLVVIFLYLGYTPEMEGGQVTARALAQTEPLLILAGYALFFAAIRLLYRRASGPWAQPRLTNRTMMLATVLFSADVYLLGLKELVWSLPLTARISSLDGLVGLVFFFGYLLLGWLAAWPSLRRWSGPELTLGRHLSGQFRLVAPLLLPWLLISFISDFMTSSPRHGWTASWPLFGASWGSSPCCCC